MAKRKPRKNPHAAALGRLGGRARTEALTPARRQEIARMGGTAKRKATA